MRIGTDIIEIERIEAAAHRSPLIVSQILSPQEKALYETFAYGRQMEFLAGRFAAKEAYAKALGVGVNSKVQMKAIDIQYTTFGSPILVAGPIIDGVQLSISHSKTTALAMCVIDLTEDRIRALLEERGFTYGENA